MKRWNTSIYTVPNHGNRHMAIIGEVSMKWSCSDIKLFFGSNLNAGIMENQKTEIELKCSILNKFTGTGMPDSYKIN
jgi:hypothetical protein